MPIKTVLSGLPAPRSLVTTMTKVELMDHFSKTMRRIKAICDVTWLLLAAAGVIWVHWELAAWVLNRGHGWNVVFGTFVFMWVMFGVFLLMRRAADRNPSPVVDVIEVTRWR